ncbi:MAG: hypothetical protein JOY85_03540 [Acidobacteriaceae bacterium]|nr:hypothetical protein [Acidobacteriaceae bacterium]
MRIRRCRATLAACSSILCMAGTLWAQDISGSQSRNEGTHVRTQSEGVGAPEIIPHRNHQRLGGMPPAGSTGSILPPISYHGGPVMGTPTVYLIWYGNWQQTNNSDTADGQQIVRDFLYGLSGSGYYATNTTYYDSYGNAPSGNFAVAGEYTDSYSQGTALADRSVRNVVSRAISIGALPRDTNGIYFVLTSSDVLETSGFCSRYCGWHTSGTISGLNIKYAFVGNAYQCLNGCAAQSVGPNGNAGVDGMVSVLAHELEETNTDPNGNAWFDSKGAEDADKCAWTFGSNLSQASNGAYYNLTLPIDINGHTRNYLVQRELDAGSLCFVDYSKEQQ